MLTMPPPTVPTPAPAAALVPAPPADALIPGLPCLVHADAIARARWFPDLAPGFFEALIRLPRVGPQDVLLAVATRAGEAELCYQLGRQDAEVLAARALPVAAHQQTGSVDRPAVSHIDLTRTSGADTTPCEDGVTSEPVRLELTAVPPILIEAMNLTKALEALGREVRGSVAAGESFRAFSQGFWDGVTLATVQHAMPGAFDSLLRAAAGVDGSDLEGEREVVRRSSAGIASAWGGFLGGDREATTRVLRHSARIAVLRDRRRGHQHAQILRELHGGLATGRPPEFALRDALVALASGPLGFGEPWSPAGSSRVVVSRIDGFLRLQGPWVLEALDLHAAWLTIQQAERLQRESTRGGRFGSWWRRRWRIATGTGPTTVPSPRSMRP